MRSSQATGAHGARGECADKGGEASAARPAIEPDLEGLLRRVPAILYIAETDAPGCWHYASPQIEDILGFSSEEWCAQPGLWQRQLHPADRKRVLRSETSALAAGTGQEKLEYRMRHRDGHTVWVSDEAALVSGPGGPRRHGVITDITHLKQAEAELEQRAAQQAAVARLGEHALEGASPSEMMQEAVSAAADILQVKPIAVLEFEEPDRLVLRAAVGWPNSEIGRGRRTAGTRSAAGYAVMTRSPVLVRDWEEETRFARPPVLNRIKARSGMAVPIEGRERPFGAFAVQSPHQRDFSSGDLAFVQALANVLADTLERQATEDASRHRALHDPLTSLPNRVLFLDRVEQALSRVRRSGALAAVLFLDLDHFKLINDSLGHEAGDELIATAGPRIEERVRATDTVARIGGDEFAVLLEDLDDEHQATEAAERIGAAFTRPFVLAGSEHFVTASVGIAFAGGEGSSHDLIRDADAAMFRAKERGRARYELFDEVMRARAVSRLQLENDLRRAVQRQELEVHYQPLVSLPTGTIVGAEALLRWEPPADIRIGTEEFVPIAEENGLIEPIGRWVLEQACTQAVCWQDLASEDFAISVNLSPVQVAAPGLVESISEVLERTGLEASRLCLEITETALLQDDSATVEILSRLRELGVRLVLDDFGTCYSSLAYLSHLPLDALKVDRAFVGRLGGEDSDTAITEAILAMSQALDLEVVAEGIETARQVEELTRLGCHYGQGFWFAHPLPEAEMTSLLRTGGALLAGVS